MKKEVRKYLALRHYTEDDIRQFGHNNWIRKNAAWIIVYVMLILAVMIAMSKLPSIYRYTVVLPIILIPFIIGCVKCYKAGKKFFNKVKDMPEPIDIDNVK